MQISKLHYITQETESQSHIDCAMNALKGGVKWIQLRVKNKSEETVFDIAEELKIICQQFGATLILNDYLNIAKELNLDGIHLGLTDTSTKIAREVLGSSKIIGGTANTLEDVLYHVENGVDYVGIGPYRFTQTKENLSPIVGEVGYKNLIQELKKRNIHIPLIAIGGITTEDFPTIFKTGIRGIAIASLINLAPNPSQKAKEVLEEIEKHL